MSDKTIDTMEHMIPIPKPTTDIYIAEDVIISCNASHINNWQRKIIKWLTGWRYEEIAKGEPNEDSR